MINVSGMNDNVGIIGGLLDGLKIIKSSPDDGDRGVPLHKSLGSGSKERRDLQLGMILDDVFEHASSNETSRAGDEQLFCGHDSGLAQSSKQTASRKDF